jgi:hypothetical protein
MSDHLSSSLSRLAHLRERGEEGYCRALRALGIFAHRRWSYFAVLFAALALPALLLPSFNSSGLCMISAFFQVVAIWVILQVAVAWISYYALQTVNVWPFWLMLFLHLFTTGAMLDKLKLESVYCHNILAIRMYEESRGSQRNY